MNIENLIERLNQYSQSLIAYQLGADFADACMDAAATLSTLRAENEKLRAELEQVKRGRDTAVEGLRVCSIENNMECQYCLYRTARSFCWNCTDGSDWKFRGQKED